MQTKKCHKCGEENLLKSQTCFNCGAKLTAGAAIMNLIKIGGVILLFWLIGKFFM
ncbi:zinc-ribbon domain-containing protein [Maridesulfovibrio bastinii]|uniref:zinc-ribbon domain-containing protein n=1 Tax=Maridesulfovibrio bastinii TaxID=47157 RepID=UPI0012EBAD2F|nr:zinc-ribbon domain-containing protein [Maridesulfovibrio bastinii]